MIEEQKSKGEIKEFVRNFMGSYEFIRNEHGVYIYNSKNGVSIINLEMLFEDILQEYTQSSRQLPVVEDISKTTKCVFCGEEDFDNIGLKYHLDNYCKEYQSIVI